jgi:hypothetical protein
VVDRAGDRDHHVLRLVPAAVVAGDPVPGQRLDRGDVADHRPPERGRPEQRLPEDVADQVGRVVVAHGDLFEDHPALGLDVRLGEHRVGDHVADQVDRHRQVGAEHVRVVAGVLA